MNAGETVREKSVRCGWPDWEDGPDLLSQILINSGTADGSILLLFMRIKIVIKDLVFC